ncbi:MAG: hypothetical protein RIT45_615 [Pseudomonadota bacterium]|jgi:thiol-disulfide isomerase/thioredoxin
MRISTPTWWVATSLLTLTLSGCGGRESTTGSASAHPAAAEAAAAPPVAPAEPAAAPAPTAEAPRQPRRAPPPPPPATAEPLPPVAEPRGKPQLVLATPDVPLDIVMDRQIAEAAAAGQDVVVYVGASWCAPCRSFHDALKAGRLDNLLSGVRFVEFDADVDTERLRGFGYRWQYVPLFARPGRGGRATGQQFAGVPKDVLDDPIPHLAAQIDALLGRKPPAAR